MTRSTQPGLRFRTRKLSPKQLLTVLREDQIDHDEYKELTDNQFKVETGVEKSEENEYHLQEALAAALGRGNKEEAKKIVPAPPSEETKDIKYDEVYKLTFQQPSTYIRFSQTVEECTGCQYNMTSDDDVFLTAFNAKRTPSNRCSEDDFEKIMEVYELAAERHTPFAAVDQTIVPFETVEIMLKGEVDKKALGFAKDIYDYWKTSRQTSSNRPLQPTLKFEMHQDSDDADPYVCFRRRDVRQTRKTRARDMQVTEKLRRLRKELEEGRQLVLMALQRERSKRDLLNVDRSIFEQRQKVKEIRQRLGIKVDDEDLVNQKPQKKKPAEVPQLQRTPGTQLRVQPRPVDGRPVEADLLALSDIQAQREESLQREIDAKVQQHKKWNSNHVDLTAEAIMDIAERKMESSYRHAETRYQPLTPPASLDEESSQENEQTTKDLLPFSPPIQMPENSHAMFRRRIGRGGRLWVDRMRLPHSPPLESDMDDRKRDQWKYDQDSDDEPDVYMIDPYDIQNLRFRQTIPPFEPRPRRPELPAPNGQPNGLGRPQVPSTIQTTPSAKPT